MERLTIQLLSEGQIWAHAKVQALTGREAISELFAFDLDVVCALEHELPESAFPGARVSVVFEIDGRVVRTIHGMLGPILDRLDAPGAHRSYRLRVVPRLFALTLVHAQQVYLDRSIPEIIRDKLERNGFGKDDVDFRLLESYPKREIVVQYAESDLAFVSRLAEHLGIGFFFEHDGQRDKLVFADVPQCYRATKDLAEVPFRTEPQSIGVFALEVSDDLVPLVYIAHDYNYRKPDVNVEGMVRLAAHGTGGVVEYGSHVKTPEEAARVAQLRSEEALSSQRVYRGKSARPALFAGGRTTLMDHPRLASRQELLVTAVEHAATLPVFDEAREDPPDYRNVFHAVPGSVVYRPARKTPKPSITGVVTGIIQPGPGGESGVARLDEEGRYTVQLHFDASLTGLAKASHPMRMAQPFAGQGHGMHFPLRPGTEVLIAFANGDPDRPLILGALPNATSPSVVVDTEATTHRIRSPGNLIIEFGAAPSKK